MGVNDYIHVGQKIKKARLSRGLSQKEMAALMELPISTYATTRRIVVRCLQV